MIIRFMVKPSVSIVHCGVGSVVEHGFPYFVMYVAYAEISIVILGGHRP